MVAANRVARAKSDSIRFRPNANAGSGGAVQHTEIVIESVVELPLRTTSQCSARSFPSRAAAASIVSSRLAKQNLA